MTREHARWPTLNRMDSRLRVGDNAVHPLLLMFPLGLFTIAIIFDVGAMLGAPHLVETLAYWNIVAGLVGGSLAAAVAGVDILGARQVRAARIRTFGVLLDLGVLIVFAVVALIRLRTHDRGTDAQLLLVEGIGLGLAAVSTWFGGRFGPQPVTRYAGVPPGRADIAG
jgi:uncharacterized membrane protein